MQIRNGFPRSQHGYWNLGELRFIEFLRMATLSVSKSRGVNNIKSAAAQPPTPNECALRLPQVCKITGLRRSMIYRMQAEKRFPQRIKLSERAVGWLEREVKCGWRNESKAAAETRPSAFETVHVRYFFGAGKLDWISVSRCFGFKGDAAASRDLLPPWYRTGSVSRGCA